MRSFGLILPLLIMLIISSQVQSYQHLDSHLSIQSSASRFLQNNDRPGQIPPSNQNSNAGTKSQQNNLQKAENPNPQKSDNALSSKIEAKLLVAQVEKAVLGKGLKVNNGSSFQRIHIGQVQKKFLFIDLKLAEKDKWQKVTIVIFAEENGTFRKLKDCQQDGHDSCYIFNSLLKKQSVLMLAIKCQDQCTYSLNSRWSDLQHLVPGNSYSFVFGKYTFQLYHVQLEDRNFKEFRVHIAPRTTRRPFDNIKIYGKYGTETGLSRENYDFKSVNLWQDGQGLFLIPKNMNSTNFDLLLIGQAQTTYQLTCQLIKQENHQIKDGEHVYQYLYAGYSKSYHISSFDTKRFEEFSLKVSVLTGNVEVAYFYDKDLNEKLPFEPFKYMHDSQYIFLSKQVEQFASKGVYIKITSSDSENEKARDATYTIKYESRQNSDAVQLKEHVYGFVTVENSKFAYFNFKRWLQQTQDSLKFTVSALQVLGNSQLQFLTCKKKLHVCTDPQLYKSVTEPITPKSKELISQKQRYQFQISDNTLEKINNFEQEGLVIVRITKEPQQQNDSGYNLVAVQFINNKKVLALREGRPLQDKLSARQSKTYKYINSDQNVKQIRIHVNQIGGVIKLKGVIQDPSSSSTIAVRPQGTTLRFVSNLTSPILVTITAESKAIFGISMQIILQKEATGIADVRAIGEDLAYTVRIGPNALTIFEITPVFYDFLFKYQSSQTIIACAINIVTNQCLNANNSINSIFTQQGQITQAQLSKQRKARVKITNPFSDSTAQVTIIFHSRNFKHCDQRKIGKAYSEQVKNGTCYTYKLQDEAKAGLQLYISKRQLANMTYSVLICGNSIKDAIKLKTLTFSSESINSMCQLALQDKKIDVFWYVNTDNAGMRDYSVKVDFVLQKIGGIVVLPEGLSYSVVTMAKDGVLKTFGYSLINKIDARVYVHQNIGKFKAFAKVISEDDRQTESISEINNHATSITTNNFEQQPIIVITRQMIEKANCDRCFLLIAVYTQSQQGQGRTIDFQIQVVQKYQNLNDDTSVKGYLEGGSFAYYTYRAKEAEQTTLLFFLSDYHQRCANMYLALNQNPSSKVYVAKAIESNQLVYIHKGTSTKYFLGVQAIKTCDYALSVLQLDTSVHRLERGKQNMVKLLKGQARYFTFEQYTEEPFKILSLSRFGDIRLHLNVSGISLDKKTFTTDQLDLEKFEAKSQYPNALAVSKQDKIYCKNCDYFLAAEAVSTTFATLFLVYPQTVVPLLKHKFFSDYILKKDEVTRASYNSLQKSKLQVQIHSGSIQITAIYKEHKINLALSAKPDIQTMVIDFTEDIAKQNKIYKPSKDQQIDPYFDSMQGQKIHEKIPINFIIKALTDKSSYTMQIKSIATKGDISGFAQYQNIRAGEPNHVQITRQRVLCLDGVLRSAQEEILITTSSDNRQKLQQLIFNAKIKGKETIKVQKEILKNVMSLKLNSNQSSKAIDLFSNYQLCMKYETAQDQDQNQKQSQKSKEEIVKGQQNDNQTQGFQQAIESFKAVVTQVNSVNILPSDTQTVVKGNNTFIIHSEGEFIIDVFECKGEAKVSYSDSLASLKSSKPKLLESVGFSQQRHAVKVSQKEVTFINVTSEHALIRWLPINFENDQGLGYLRFSAGDIRYSSKFKKIIIEYQPLKMLKKTKSRVKEATYTLYVTNDSQKLQYAAQCSSFKEKQVIEVKMKTMANSLNNGQQKQYMSFNFQKTTLQANFNKSQNIYFTIVANLVLDASGNVEKADKFKTSISDKHEHYRFIYNRQQLPLQAYKPNQLETIPYAFLGLLVGSILLILITLTFLLNKKIFPWVAKLRSSNLVEQNEGGQNKDDLQMVPPSSQRNQRAPETVQTEEKMDN